MDVCHPFLMVGHIRFHKNTFKHQPESHLRRVPFVCVKSRFHVDAICQSTVLGSVCSRLSYRFLDSSLVAVRAPSASNRGVGLCIFGAMGR